LNREFGITLGLALVSVGVLSLVSTPLAWGAMRGFARMGTMMAGVDNGPESADGDGYCPEEHRAEMAEHMGNATMPHMEPGSHHRGDGHHRGMGGHMSGQPGTGGNSNHCGG